MKIEAIACFHIHDQDGQCIEIERPFPDLAPVAEVQWLLNETDALAAKLPDAWTVMDVCIELRRIGDPS